MSSHLRPRSRGVLLIVALLTMLASAACTGSASSPTASTPASQAAASPTPVVTAPATATPAPEPTSTPAPSFPITVTDDLGNSVTIPARPERIVALTPAATEILFRLGAGDRTVAKSEDIDPYPPEADGLPIVSKFTGVDVEAIVGLDADLVIGDAVNPAEAITKLKDLGLPVVLMAASSIDGALKDIELVGDAIGSGGDARDLTASMRARFDQLGALTADAPKPRVFYEIGAGDTIYTMPAESIYAEMLKLAGADPITTDASYVISLEKLVDADPEIILLADGTPVADVAKRPGWEGMTAVKDGRVIAINDTTVTRPGPRLVDGLEALIKVIHPELVIPSPAPVTTP